MSEPRGSGIVRRRGAVIGEMTQEQLDANAVRTGNCRATALPVPAIVVLETGERGDATLTRFDGRGDFCGNTWHAAEREAEAQAATEFGSALGPWTAIPTGIDACDFMRRLRQQATSDTQRGSA
jgi:hypothetical protein